MPVALAGAILVHGAIALGVSQAPRLVRSRHQVVQVDIHPVEPPREAPPPPPPSPPPEPEKPKVKKPTPATAPPPNATRDPPKEPPKEPPKPVFGVSMDSTTTDSSFSVPVGNTTVADPSAPRPSGPIEPLAPVPAAEPAPKWKPADESEIAREPDFEEGSCNATYPDGEAKQAGVEGEVFLRVELNDDGSVRNARVMRGLGYGLDELAMKLVKTRCRFTAAVNKAGKRVPYVINYRVTYQLD